MLGILQNFRGHRIPYTYVGRILFLLRVMWAKFRFKGWTLFSADCALKGLPRTDFVAGFGGAGFMYFYVRCYGKFG